MKTKSKIYRRKAYQPDGLEYEGASWNSLKEFTEETDNLKESMKALVDSQKSIIESCKIFIKDKFLEEIATEDEIEKFLEGFEEDYNENDDKVGAFQRWRNHPEIKIDINRYINDEAYKQGVKDALGYSELNFLCVIQDMMKSNET